MSSPFRLENLPGLAIAEVAANMDFQAVVHLSLISKRFTAWMTRHTKTIPIYLKVENSIHTKSLVFETDEIHSPSRSRHQFYTRDDRRFTDDSPTLCIQKPFGSDVCWRYNGIKAPMASEEGNWYYKKVSIGFENEATGFNSIIDYFVGNFNVKEISFEIENPQKPELAAEVLVHCKKIGLAFNTVKWAVVSCDDKTRYRALEACSNSVDLTFHGGYSASFTFDKIHEFTIGELNIFDAAWVTADKVCAMENVKNITLSSTHLSSSDMNSILKKWTAGELSHWAHMYVANKGPKFNTEKVLEELHGGPQERQGKFWLRNVNGVYAKLAIGQKSVCLETQNGPHFHLFAFADIYEL